MVCAALAIVSIDVTVLHVASPAIMEAFDPTPTAMLWVIDVFPFVIAPLLLSSGVLGDRFGRRRFLLIGLAVFGAASAAAALAPTVEVLIAARAVTAVGGAMILPTTMSLVRVAYPDRQRRIRAVAIWSMTSAGAAAIGPTLGGFLVQNFSWHAVFLVNVPLCIILIVAAALWTRESRSANPAPFDLVSQALAVGAVLAAGFAANELSGDQPVTTVTAAVLSVALGALFVRRQTRLTRAGVQPTLDVRLFRSRAFSASLIAIALAMFAIVGLDLQFAQYLQLTRGLAAFSAALALLPLAIATMVGGLISPFVIRRLGHRMAITAGLALGGVALAVIAIPRDTTDLLFFGICTAFLGLGIEVVAVAANDLIISAAHVDEVGGAAALEEISYDLGGGFGIAVLGAITALAAGGEAGFHLVLTTSAILLVASAIAMALVLRRAVPAA